jgi:hypothetical protein
LKDVWVVDPVLVSDPRWGKGEQVAARVHGLEPKRIGDIVVLLLHWDEWLLVAHVVRSKLRADPRHNCAIVGTAAQGNPAHAEPVVLEPLCRIDNVIDARQKL